MPSSHIVKQGDHLSRLAQQYGFRDYRIIWNHALNAELKESRVNPNVLYPGDVLHIPDKQPKTESRPTADVHRFEVSSPKLMLRLVVRDWSDQAMANCACELEIDGRKYPIRTDGQGRIEQAIPAASEHAVLRVPGLDMEMPLKIGHLDPADEDSGWVQRLINLGYHGKPLDDPGESRQHAIQEFQCNHKLKITGDLDEPTRAKLKDLHGC